MFFDDRFFLAKAYCSQYPSIIGRRIVQQKVFVGLLYINFPPGLDRKNMNLRFKAPYSLTTLYGHIHNTDSSLGHDKRKKKLP